MRTLINHKTILITLFLSIYLLLGNLTTKAYANFDVSVFPPIVQLEVTPPTSLDTPITIQNSSDTAVDLQVQLRSFTPQQNGQVVLQPENAQIIGNDPLIFQKVQIRDGDQSIDNITLAPQQQKQLTLHVYLNKDEPSGDYYFSIVFVSKNNEINQKNDSDVIGGIATHVILSIGPLSKTSGAIETYSAPWFVQSGPLPITLLLANTSDHFITPKGNIIISNMFGQAVGRIQLLPVNILSRSSRYIPDNNGSLSTNTIIWNEHFLLGIYQAKLSIILSDQGPIFERSIYFFAIPWQLGIGFTIATSILLLIFLRIRRRIKKI